jgi:pyruvate/2-oxoglutarate dehydrogenase complex dihydrolipoamide dehydrogenase (E3) component
MAKYDNNLTVIGGGSAGLIAAYIAATVRAKVTLVEQGSMGGDCLNTGCVPSKTLIRSARVAHTLRTAGDYGLRSVVPEVDFARVMARVRDAVATIAPKDSMERYRSLGVDCIAGSARLLDPHHVAVGDRVISSRSIVLAAGAQPLVPPIPGLADVAPLTSESLWELNELPGRLLVLGGGPIGCELAQSFQRLGSQVTLVDMEDRLLPREDPDVSAHLERVFRAEGVDVRLGHKALRVDPADATAASATQASGGGTLQAQRGGDLVALPFDRILVAVGRRPNSAGLGLEDLGIATLPNGAVQVDKYLRTSCPNIFACGDLVGPYQFTHMASHQAWFASVNALFGRFRKFAVNYSVVPWATFTDPEVGRVGLSEAQAQAEGRRVEVTLYPLDDLDRAIADGDTQGWIKVLTAPGSDRILGATIVGPEAGDLIGEFILAMTHGLGLKKLMSTIHIYPTRSEAAKLAAGAWRRRNAPQGLLTWVGRLHALMR